MFKYHTMDTASAIKTLRSRLGDSQQALANRLDLSVRAVANYEKGRQPTLAVLFTLRMIASSTNNSDLADAFSAVYAEQVRGVEKPLTDTERAWVRMVLALVRNPEEVPDLDKFALALLEALERLAANAKKKTLNTNAEELKETSEMARDFITSAERKLRLLASERKKETGETYERAYSEVLLGNPTLYKRYLTEHGLKPEDTARRYPEEPRYKPLTQSNTSKGDDK